MGMAEGSIVIFKCRIYIIGLCDLSTKWQLYRSMWPEHKMANPKCLCAVSSHMQNRSM